MRHRMKMIKSSPHAGSDHLTVSPAPQADFTKNSHSALRLHHLQGEVGLDIVPHVFLVAKHSRTLILPLIHELSKA
jgi:hypothetical protein